MCPGSGIFMQVYEKPGGIVINLKSFLPLLHCFSVSAAPNYYKVKTIQNLPYSLDVRILKSVLPGQSQGVLRNGSLWMLWGTIHSFALFSF